MARQTPGARLRAYRLRHGLSQDELAEELGCRQGTLTNLERDNGWVPSLRVALAVERWCGIEPRDWMPGQK